MSKITLLFCIAVFANISMAASVTVDMRHRPPEMIVSGKDVSGPVKDLIEAMFVGTDATFDWQIVPWPRTLSRAIKGTVDVVPRHSMNAERELYLLPMLMGFEDRHVLYLMSPKYKNPQLYDSLESMANLNFGLLRGSYYSEAIEKIKDQPNAMYANSIEQLMRLLLKERIDVLPIQNITWAEKAFEKVSKDHPSKKYVVAKYQDDFVSGKYISISKNSRLSAYFNQLNCSLYKLRKSGKVDEIYSKYNVPPYVQVFDHPESIAQKKNCLEFIKMVSKQNDVGIQ